MILVTISSSMPVVGAAIKLGASDYVNKPFTPEAIRIAVARVLGVNPSSLQVRPSRVSLQHPDDAVTARLRSLLPSHVELTASPTLVKLLESVEKSPFDVVLLDSHVLEGEVVTAAMLVRKSAPDAAVFALADPAPESGRWAPDGALDGILPVSLDEAVVKDFLYANFLRPLVFQEGTVFHAAGHEGDDKNPSAYFAALSRALYRRCSHEGPTFEPSIDLTRVPPFPGRIAELMAELRTRFDPHGTVPAFRVAPALVATLTSRPELRRVVDLRLTAPFLAGIPKEAHQPGRSKLPVWPGRTSSRRRRARQISRARIAG